MATAEDHHANERDVDSGAVLRQAVLCVGTPGNPLKSTTAVARRYARALLEVALEQGRALGVATDLSAVAATVSHHRELASVLSQPTVALPAKKKIVAAIWEKADPLVARLLELLVERDRIAEIGAVAIAFEQLWNAHRGIVPVGIVSAAPLGAEETEALAAALRRMTGKEVALEASVAPELLGGLLLRMEGKTYDGTVRTRIRTLRNRLAQGTPHA